MFDLITKVSIREMYTARMIIATTIDKLSFNYVENILTPINNSMNLHCYTCIITDVITTSIMVYILLSRVNGELSKLESIKPLTPIKRKAEEIIFIILFIFTKNVENVL